MALEDVRIAINHVSNNIANMTHQSAAINGAVATRKIGNPERVPNNERDSENAKKPDCNTKKNDK